MHTTKLNRKIEGLETIQVVKEKQILHIRVLGGSYQPWPFKNPSISKTSFTQMDLILTQSFFIIMLNHGQIFHTHALTCERYQEKGLQT